MKLTPEERANALEILHSERFVDASPHTIHATPLEEGHYPCSVRTLYRILAAEDEARERRAVLRRPTYAKPELLATGPKQPGSWDIAKLKGPDRHDFPERVGCLEDARAHCQRFFHWYNNDHRHSGMAFMTPCDVPYGRVPDSVATPAPRPLRRPSPLTRLASRASGPRRSAHRRRSGSTRRPNPKPTPGSFRSNTNFDTPVSRFH